MAFSIISIRISVALSCLSSSSVEPLLCTFSCLSAFSSTTIVWPFLTSNVFVSTATAIVPPLIRCLGPESFV